MITLCVAKVAVLRDTLVAGALVDSATVPGVVLALRRTRRPLDTWAFRGEDEKKKLGERKTELAMEAMMMQEVLGVTSRKRCLLR